MGIEGIYLGGWATSAKGSLSEDPGPDLASYPLSQVPDEAAGLVRALLTADRNQQYLRLRMTDADAPPRPPPTTGRSSSPTPTPATAETRTCATSSAASSKSGVPGYHIEDQRPGTKKCGHQGGKVLVPSDEQIKRLNTARFQLDVMRVPGIIVARTDAEAANLIESRADERDQPFILGATNLKVPPYKACFLALMRSFHAAGVTDLRGHLLYALPDGEYAAADAWLERQGITPLVTEAAASWQDGTATVRRRPLRQGRERFVDAWQADAGLETYGEAVAELLAFREREGEPLDVKAAEWRKFAATASLYAAREKARELGADVPWDCERAKTPEGYYQVRGGIPYAIAKSLAAAPFATCSGWRRRRPTSTTPGTSPGRSALSTRTR